MVFYTYIVECADKTLYVGRTTDIQRRIVEHNSSPKGAKYTRARRPIILRHVEEFETLSESLKREAALKKLSRKDKLALL